MHPLPAWPASPLQEKLFTAQLYHKRDISNSTSCPLFSSKTKARTGLPGRAFSLNFERWPLNGSLEHTLDLPRLHVHAAVGRVGRRAGHGSISYLAPLL